MLLKTPTSPHTKAQTSVTTLMLQVLAALVPDPHPHRFRMERIALEHRHLLAEVAAQVNQRYSIVRLPEFLNDAQCFVRAAVIDIGDLKIKRQAGQYFGNGLVKFRQNYFFIEYRRYD